MRDSLVLRLDRADFERIAARCPSIWRTLTSALSQRLAATTAPEAVAPDPRPRTIAILRAGSSQIPQRFLEKLVAVFAAGANTLVLDAAGAGELLPAGPALDGAEATQALNKLESSYDYLIFLTDAELTPWSQKAIRHADLVLAVAVDGADPTPNPLEQLALAFVGTDAHRLVIVHERRQPISGTARWLRRRKVAMHHHVALDDDSTIARLYRFINGTALGLIACGGGALCAAHVGLYKALIESGFEFDALGGTSAGAAMTGAFAMGKHPDDIDRGTHDIFVTNRAMQRYTWAAVLAARSSPLRHAAAALLRRHQHRGSLDSVLCGVDEPVELRAASSRPRRPVRSHSRLGPPSRCCCLRSIRRTARCWSTAACSTTCRCASCTS
ncbi:MAG: patatin-like phospholipase family protein [Hyphomicrobium sp.]